MAGEPNAIAETEDFEFAALERAVNYRAALLREFEHHLKGDILEVGAGIGQYTAQLSAIPGVRGVTSVEPERRFGKTFRQNHPETTLVEGTIDNVPTEVEWDGLLSVNVLEHIADDEAELAKYARKLKARHGCLCLFVPARPELHAPIDKEFGHFRRYKRPELRTKLRRNGFDVLRMDYFNFVGYFGWWLSFRLLRQHHFDRGSVTLFDRFIFPAAHAIEYRVMRPPIGQSLLAVGRAR